MESQSFDVTLEREESFRFTVTFDGTELPELTMDEPAPLGDETGPNAARLLGAAVGHCLSASLLFCLQKARIAVGAIQTTVRGTIARNELGRFRIAELEVTLSPSMTSEARERVGRCLEVFENFCIVTESVRHGIPVRVTVTPQVEARENIEVRT